MFRIKERRSIFLLLLLPLAAVIGFCLYSSLFHVREDEVALRIQLDIEEDIGLLVYDYTVAGHECSGGISNADRSMLGRDEELIVTWNEEDLLMEDIPSEIPFCLTFRVITEYRDPNFDNDYPEEITVYLDPVSWNAHLGEEYRVRITGDRENGYVASLE